VESVKMLVYVHRVASVCEYWAHVFERQTT